jgi:hypothetical protein
MNIIIHKNKPEPEGSPKRIQQANPFASRVGAWGVAKAVYPVDHSVDVLLDTGIFVHRVPVASKEWVKDYALEESPPDPAYTSGERNLPTIEARVFVFMPTGDLDGCFIPPFSGFVIPQSYAAFSEDWNKDSPPPESEKPENTRKFVLPGNWKGNYNYITGRFELISPDEKTSFLIDYTDDNGEPEQPEVHLKLFDNPDEEEPGINMDVVSGKTVDISVFNELKTHHDTENNKASLTLFQNDDDAPGLTVEMEAKKTIHISAFDELDIKHTKGSSNKMILFDEYIFEHTRGSQTKVTSFKTVSTAKSSGEASMVTPGPISIISRNADLIKISNAIGSLGGIVNDILDALIELKVMGPIAHPFLWVIPKILPIKLKWNMVFKK